ncbi:ABC transporter ATP-binding protein [Streptomyces sp. NPDC051320]|uniref:ABC transporter ATP-binding protein n=1 Tax=Streptomyces sp. NPDC051320 TaxID=3154644 RepID=UPI0034298D89
MIRTTGTSGTGTSTASGTGTSTASGDRAAAVLSANGLGHDYGERTVLGGVDFSVARGEFVCLVGPSGAGKTTLLRCLAGLQTPTRGWVEFENVRITRPPRDVAVVFQDYSRSLLPWASVLDNVTLPLRSAGVRKAEARRRAHDALEAVGLASADPTSYPWQLSGGMQQRVAIARAIACGPSLVLMDEPFASVDAQTRADLEDLMRRLQTEMDLTVLLVTHDIDEAVYLSDRVVVLSGAPATVSEVVDVPLGTTRDQLETKTLPAFAELRGHVYRLICRPGDD